MSIAGELKEAFSGRTLNMEIPEQSHIDECIKLSREQYCRPLSEVKQILTRWEEGDFDPASSTQEPPNSPFEEVEFEEPII